MLITQAIAISVDGAWSTHSLFHPTRVLYSKTSSFSTWIILTIFWGEREKKKPEKTSSCIMCRNNYFDRASQEQTAVQISALWTAKGILFTDVDKMLKGECRMNAGSTLTVYYIAISRKPKVDEGEKSWFSALTAEPGSQKGRLGTWVWCNPSERHLC